MNIETTSGLKERVEKIEEPKIEVKKPMRQIVIETDGNSVHLVKADVSGRLELMAILENLLNYLNKQ